MAKYRQEVCVQASTPHPGGARIFVMGKEIWIKEGNTIPLAEESVNLPYFSLMARTD